MSALAADIVAAGISPEAVDESVPWFGAPVLVHRWEGVTEGTYLGDSGWIAEDDSAMPWILLSSFPGGRFRADEGPRSRSVFCHVSQVTWRDGTPFDTLYGYVGTVATPADDDGADGAPACRHCAVSLVRGYDTPGGPWAHLYAGAHEGRTYCLPPGHPLRGDS